jgi:hypothetical protein
MRIRHAAALALVAWYLMIPPTSTLPRFDRGDGGVFDLFRRVYDGRKLTLADAIALMTRGDEEPVFSRDWITMYSFDDLPSCYSAMGKINHAFDSLRDKKVADLPPDLVNRAVRWAAGNCIISDDPRLGSHW